MTAPSIITIPPLLPSAVHLFLPHLVALLDDMTVPFPRRVKMTYRATIALLLVLIIRVMLAILIALFITILLFCPVIITSTFVIRVATRVEHISWDPVDYKCMTSPARVILPLRLIVPAVS